VKQAGHDTQWRILQFTMNGTLDSSYFARALRFSFAQSLSDGTGFIGGPPSVPQAHGPCILASVIQEQDFVFRQAQT
jgi:hypothetical protein